jgi:MoaA/NifB/PqqE/SkfB family radical SAM enzyme
MKIDKYNPFNGDKALCHVDRWKLVKKGIVMSPVFVSLDLSEVCNLNCTFCNARKVRGKVKMDRATIDKAVGVLARWGTRAVCIGGGGESTLNPNIGYAIKRLHEHGVSVGIVTNGVKIPLINPEFVSWIGVSVDAATNKTYGKIKGCRPATFDKVIENIKFFKKHYPSIELTYKFLLHPLNEREVKDAIGLAKEIGCDRIHIRPGSYAWFDKTGKQFEFKVDSYRLTEEDIDRGRLINESENFRVHAVYEKFNRMFKPKIPFDRCYAGFATCYISPRGGVGLCCDRRGDKKMMLGNLDNIEQRWGSQMHRNILKSVDVLMCPRCTYSHVNQIFENVIMEDRMMVDFI